MKNPRQKGATLPPYYLVRESRRTDVPTDGTVVDIPSRHGVFFTTAHANLLEMLAGNGRAIAGVADAKYMFIPVGYVA